VPPQERKRLSPKTLELMERYTWPGNVRELVNVVQRALILAEGEEIMPRVLPGQMLDAIEVQGRPLGVRLDIGYQEAKQTFLEHFDRAYVESLLEESGGNLSKAAQLAEMDRSNFRKLVLRTGLLAGNEDLVES
jgi:DNA-binding NtrC family response regulator